VRDRRTSRYTRRRGAEDSAVVIIDESKAGREEKRDREKEKEKERAFQERELARPLYRLISFGERSLTAAD
jgi:hypothetical protein